MVTSESCSRVQGAHDRAGQAAPAAHRRLQPPPVPADVDGAGYERLQGVGGGVTGFGFGERDLEPGSPGLRLELGGRAAGDDVTVVDDHDPVGELVRLVE